MVETRRANRHAGYTILPTHSIFYSDRTTTDSRKYARFKKYTCSLVNIKKNIKYIYDKMNVNNLGRTTKYQIGDTKRNRWADYFETKIRSWPRIVTIFLCLQRFHILLTQVNISERSWADFAAQSVFITDTKFHFDDVQEIKSQ